jgi:hypothetical protein
VRERLSAQDLRDLLEAALDRSLPEVERRNAVSMLRARLGDALEDAEEVAPSETT